ncbi:DUF1579 family protein [Edaphobacter modestus]|uniref:Uncharacterized protein DUF1579 n=1 Tax=Edaphobacter modestus TaxID=388466 RepID=A0A4Q7YPQ1_9BACT|nr:DUF1579 family protein [Edaphobacter modestus]RZU39054.1 uncharacterized protein DUF1579 [Edaphobacter modestus]
MRRAVRLAAMMLLGTLIASAQLPVGQPPKARPEPSPLEPIAWMTGHWVAEAKSPGTDRVSKIDTRYTPQMNGRTMSLETSFDGVLVYEGMFAYDPAQKAIAFWYVTPEGESIRGTVDPQPNGDQLYDFQMTLANGVSLHFRTEVHRVDPDHYVWTLFTNSEGTKWDKLIEVNYHRAP